MKTIGLKETNLDACVKESQQQRIVITRNGKPVALVVGVEGLDTEQLELGSSSKFWELITHRRLQRTVTREQLEEKIRNPKKRPAEAAQNVAAVRAAVASRAAGYPRAKKRARSGS